MKKTMKILFLILFGLYQIGYSQIEKKQIYGHFQEVPNFNSSCGIHISAEEVKLTIIPDSIQCFIKCSEIFKGTKVDLYKEYLFEYYLIDYKDLNTQIIGIMDKKRKIAIVDNFK